MSLSARAIAVEGVGYAPAVLARAGLWESVSAAAVARPLERPILIRGLRLGVIRPFLERDRFGRLVARRGLAVGRAGAWAGPDVFAGLAARHQRTSAIKALQLDEFAPLGASAINCAQIRAAAGADVWTTVPARRGLPPLAVLLHVISQ